MQETTPTAMREEMREQREMSAEEQTEQVRRYYALEEERLRLLDAEDRERREVEEEVRSLSPIRALPVAPPRWAQKRILEAYDVREQRYREIATEQEAIWEALGGEDGFRGALEAAEERTGEVIRQ
jgi:hypothetical protein